MILNQRQDGCLPCRNNDLMLGSDIILTTEYFFKTKELHVLFVTKSRDEKGNKLIAQVTSGMFPMTSTFMCSVGVGRGDMKARRVTMWV